VNIEGLAIRVDDVNHRALLGDCEHTLNAMLGELFLRVTVGGGGVRAVSTQMYVIAKVVDISEPARVPRATCSCVGVT
jgi:hypothetical protein